MLPLNILSDLWNWCFFFHPLKDLSHYSFSKYLLSSSHEPGTVLGIWGTSLNKDLWFWRIYLMVFPLIYCWCWAYVVLLTNIMRLKIKLMSCLIPLCIVSMASYCSWYKHISTEHSFLKLLCVQPTLYYLPSSILCSCFLSVSSAYAATVPLHVHSFWMELSPLYLVTFTSQLKRYFPRRASLASLTKLNTLIA